MAWGAIGLFFNVYIKRNYRSWWLKYNYLLSAALDAALALATFFIFFCLSYPGVTLGWWGNNAPFATADALGTPLDVVTEGSHFGPDTWK